MALWLEDVKRHVRIDAKWNLRSFEPRTLCGAKLGDADLADVKTAAKRLEEVTCEVCRSIVRRCC